MNVSTFNLHICDFKLQTWPPPSPPPQKKKKTNNPVLFLGNFTPTKLVESTQTVAKKTQGLLCIWPNGIIFHQPRFPWNKGPISLPKSYLLGEIGRVRSRANLTIYVSLKHHKDVKTQWKTPSFSAMKVVFALKTLPKGTWTSQTLKTYIDLLKMLGKSKQYYPKWWWKMVIYHSRIRK